MWRCNMKIELHESDFRAAGAAPAGITLIEMLVVVTIIALFAALVAPRMIGKADEAKPRRPRAQVNTFMTALGAYKLDTGTYPSTDRACNALRVKPENVTQWAGPYLPQDIPNDPWGHPYLYKYPGRAWR